VCAIAAPSLLLHKKLAKLSTHSKEHKEKELRGKDKESEGRGNESEVRGGSSGRRSPERGHADAGASSGRASPNRCGPTQLSPSKVVSVCVGGGV